MSPWREEGLELWPGEEELSPEHSPVDTPDSESGAGEWSLGAIGDNSGSLRLWREELALSIPAISAEARLLDSFLNRLLVFRLLSASLFLLLSLAAVTVLLAILMELGSLLLPPVLMLVVSRGVALMVTASPPLTNENRLFRALTNERRVLPDQELEHLGVVEALHWLTVDVGHQVPGPQPRVIGGGTRGHLHHQVVH